MADYDETAVIRKQEEIEARIRELINDLAGDTGEVERYIASQEESYGEDITEFAFREAVRAGNTAFVEAHACDVELNDGDGYSTYLEETDNADMQQLLMERGAFRSWDDYENCRFATETVNGTILAFDDSFQQEAYEKYKATFGLTDEDIENIISGYEEDEDGNPYDTDRDVEYDMETLGVTVDCGIPSFAYMCGEDSGDLVDLLAELGWDCEFEGSSWKLETTGVYFIR